MSSIKPPKTGVRGGADPGARHAPSPSVSAAGRLICPAIGHAKEASVMKVTDVRLETYRWDNATEHVNGRWVFGFDGIDVARVETDQGITGLGLTWGIAEASDIGRSVAQFLKRSVVGRDPFDTERIWEDMWKAGHGSRRGIGTMVLGAIDTALWDIKGKACGLPLYKLLGGYTDRVPAYVSRGFRGLGPAEVADSMELALAEGAPGVKMFVGGIPIRDDVERVRIARQTLGPDVKLMIDASSSYRHHEAIVFARAVEEYDIFWLEEPVAVDDLRGYQLLAQATSIPIATGEGEQTRYGYRDLIEDRCAAILQPDVMVMGGVTEWMKVAAMAQAYDIAISHHGTHLIHAHLLAAIPNAIIAEEYYTSPHAPIDGGIFVDPIKIVDGYLCPPDRPGLGMELNEEAIGPHRTG